jgi:hypothetical protein
MYVPVRALREAEQVGGLSIPAGATTYLPLADIDLLADAIHVAVVGPLTPSNSDTVVQTGGSCAVVSAQIEVNVAAGELRTRSTGVYQAFNANATLALKAADGSKDRTSLVVVKISNGAVSVVDGALAEPGLSVAPECPEGYVPLCSALVKKSGTEVSTITDLRPRP